MFFFTIGNSLDDINLMKEYKRLFNWFEKIRTNKLGDRNKHTKMK